MDLQFIFTCFLYGWGAALAMVGSALLLYYLFADEVDHEFMSTTGTLTLLLPFTLAVVFIWGVCNFIGWPLVKLRALVQRARGRTA
jgi:cell division protein FtsX